jgi:hypothetical protein
MCFDQITATTISSETNARNNSPIPIRTPIAAVVQIAAAVVNPPSFAWDFQITPAPMKPMPVTIWEITLVGSMVLPGKPLSVGSIETKVNMVEPMQIKVNVRMPAG